MRVKKVKAKKNEFCNLLENTRDPPAAEVDTDLFLVVCLPDIADFNLIEAAILIFLFFIEEVLLFGVTFEAGMFLFFYRTYTSSER